MIKKRWFLIGVIIIVLIVFLFWFFKLGSDVLYWMNGYVAEVNGNLLVVSGVTRFSEPGTERQEKRTIKFQLNSKTKFEKTTTILYRSKNNFSSEVAQGSASDLSKNMRIVKIESNTDLFMNNEAQASYVNYEVVEIRD